MTDFFIKKISRDINITKDSWKKLGFCADTLSSWSSGISFSLMNWASEEFINSSSIRLFGGLFEHRLTPFQTILFYQSYYRLFHKPNLELNACNFISSESFESSIRNQSSFENMLRFVHYLVSEVPHSFRKNNVVCGDVDENSPRGRFFYIDTKSISSELCILFEEVSRISLINDIQEKLMIIIKVYIDLLSIHIFQDGNGRVSRCIFNLLLRHFFHEEIFIPMSVFTSISGPSINLYLREAQLLGDYNGFISVFYNIIWFVNENHKKMPIIITHVPKLSFGFRLKCSTKI